MKLTRTNLWGISQAGRANFQPDSEAKLKSGGWLQSLHEMCSVCPEMDGYPVKVQPTVPPPRTPAGVPEGCGDEDLQGQC